MQGDGENTETPGIVQMAARDLFNLMGESQNRVFLMRVSYLEIYQEEIRDLLNPSPQRLQVGAREGDVVAFYSLVESCRDESALHPSFTVYRSAISKNRPD